MGVSGHSDCSPAPCSSPGRSLEPSQPYPGPQGRPPVPTDPARLMGPRDSPPPLPARPCCQCVGAVAAVPSEGQLRSQTTAIRDHGHPRPRPSWTMAIPTTVLQGPWPVAALTLQRHRPGRAGQTRPVSGTLWGPRRHVRGRVGGPGLCSHSVSPPWGPAKAAWTQPLARLSGQPAPPRGERVSSFFPK